MGPAEYQDIAGQIITDRLPCSQFEPDIQDCRFSLAFSKHKPGLMLRTTWRTTHQIILRISTHHTATFMIITLFFSVVVSNQRFSNRSCTTDVGVLKLSSDSFCRNRVFNMNTEFCCHFCCSRSMILDTIPFNVRRSLSLSSGFRPSFLLAAASPQLTFYNFKFSDFKKETTSSLKMIRIMIETRWSVF
jgi:hypothetical protein